MGLSRFLLFGGKCFPGQIHDTLATCGWHASRCVSGVHGDHPVLVSTVNEGALCNECLAQVRLCQNLLRGFFNWSQAFYRLFDREVAFNDSLLFYRLW